MHGQHGTTTGMSRVDVNQVDLNLLVVLDALLQERNVTRAARRVHRTQSAVSHALGRLRTQLNDPLLVRVGGEMRPTPRALKLAPEVTRILATIQRVLTEEDAFRPSTSARTFRLAGPDFVSAALPALTSRMAHDAPHTTVHLEPATPTMLGELTEDRLDTAVAPPRDVRMPGVSSEPLVSMPWAVFARRGHPAIRRWDRAAWARHPHLRIRTPSEGPGPVDKAARAAGLTRTAGPSLPHFLLAAPVLAQTDFLFTAPRGSLASVAARFDLEILPCPLAIPPVRLMLFWAQSRGADPAVRWFRTIAAAAIREGLSVPDR